jgi:hypothetical protein
MYIHSTRGLLIVLIPFTKDGKERELLHTVETILISKKNGMLKVPHD